MDQLACELVPRHEFPIEENSVGAVNGFNPVFRDD
jgi:hypothetical protein